jgi:hypothetical protein
VNKQTLITLSLAAVSLALLANFILIWIFGKYIAYENNKVILAAETFFVFGAFGIGLIEFLRSCARKAQINQRVLAVEHVEEGTDIKIVEQNEEFWKLNWRFTLRNPGVHPLKFDVFVKCFDVDGSIIHNDFTRDLLVAPDCRSVFSDFTLVPSSVAESIAHARVEIVRRAQHKESSSRLSGIDSRVLSYGRSQVT